MRIVVMMVLTGPLPCDYCPLLGGSAVNGFSVTHSNILLRSPSAHSNSVLTVPNNLYRHTCYCLGSVKQAVCIV